MRNGDYEQEALTAEELDRERAERLPERTLMSTFVPQPIGGTVYLQSWWIDHPTPPE